MKIGKRHRTSKKTQISRYSLFANSFRLFHVWRFRSFHIFMCVKLLAQAQNKLCFVTLGVPVLYITLFLRGLFQGPLESLTATEHVFCGTISADMGFYCRVCIINLNVLCIPLMVFISRFLRYRYSKNSFLNRFYENGNWFCQF
jgi:hypothetical protein